MPGAASMPISTTTAGRRACGATSSAGRQLVGPSIYTRCASRRSTLTLRLASSVV